MGGAPGRTPGASLSHSSSCRCSCSAVAGDRATLRLLPGYTKNGQEAVLPLKSDVAELLRRWLAHRPAARRLWGGDWSARRQAATMIQVDLTAANIDHEDNDGRVADFHALRHTFISNLARAGVHPRNTQALARHSTIDLTMNVYTHVAMSDLHDDVESLPGLPGNQGDRDKKTATTATPTGLAAVPDAPAELAALISAWKDLPDNVRSAIGALART